MLLILSDLHFTDESTAVNVNPEAFDLLSGFALDTMTRRKVKELHVVLLGDIFDLVRSAAWLETCPRDERPWNGVPNPRTGVNAHPAVAGHFSRVLAAILSAPSTTHFVTTLGLLRQRAAQGGIPFRVTYVAGNHDRALFNFPDLIRQVTAVLPEVTRPAHAFESSAYSLLGRHGHEWDEHCHGYRFRNKVLVPGEKVDRFAPEAYEVMAIGEVITAELMGGIIVGAARHGADAGFLAELKDLNNLRPMTAVFAWLEWLGAERVIGDREILLKALHDALDGVLESRLARQWDKLVPDTLLKADLTDRLQQVRALLLGTSFDTFRKRVGTVEKLLEFAALFSRNRDTLLEGAKKERVFQGPIGDKGTQYVVYGHTHRARTDYVSGRPDGRVRMYLNAGTYLPLIARAEDFKTFGRSTQMTLSYFFREDEDTDRKVPGTVSADTWYGIRRKLYV